MTRQFPTTSAMRGTLILTLSAVLFTGVAVSPAAAEDFVPAPEVTGQTATDTVPGLPPLPEPAAVPPAEGVAPMATDGLAAAIESRIKVDAAFRKQFVAALQQRLATDPAFAASFVAMIRQRAATDAFFRATWAAALRAQNGSLVNLGATTWEGGTLRHPRGVAYYPAVTRWANLTLGVMAELDIDASYLPGILAQIQQESAGQPTAVNAYDSNARAGYASMGLLQTIAPTYRANAKPGYEGTLTRVSVPGTGIPQQFASPWQTHPYANLYAALNYVIKRYGYSKFILWNTGSNGSY